jgi:hypothetical protein
MLRSQEGNEGLDKAAFGGGGRTDKFLKKTPSK